MKRFLIISVVLLAWVASYAQYFGSPVFKEGFDNEDVFNKWQQENKAAGDLTLWEISENDTYSFTDIDATSTSSAVLSLRSKNIQLTLTSPEIDLSGKQSLQIGFYGYDLYYCLRGGVDFRFRVTGDNGITWVDLFKQGDDPRTETVKGWNLYKYVLPSQFDGGKVRLQFYVDVPESANPSGLEGYVDGVFVSERSAIEPGITSVNYSTDERRPTSGAFGKEEPVTIQFTNEGSQPISSIDLYYQVDDQPEVVETYVPQEAVKTGETVEYTFMQKADLGMSLASFILKAGVRMEGDENPDNNELIAYIENITAGIPYVPGFIQMEDGAITVSTDEWNTMENNYEAYWDYNVEGNHFYWIIEPEWAEEDCDAYVISRPVHLEGGKTYSVAFDVYTVTEGTGINKMKVYAATDKDLENPMTEIWKNEAIGADNTLNNLARFQAPTSGIYYFAFNCLSTPGAGEMRLDNIAVREVSGNDAGIVDILKPVNHPYLFGNAEEVEVVVRNLGLGVIPANTMKVNLRLNDGDIVSETIGKALEPNEQLTHTFGGKLDLSDVSSRHLLAVWTSLPDDQNAGNDTITIDYVSTVTGIPYIPNFGDASQKSDELDYWTVVDKNADYYKFNPSSETDLNTYIYSYGGGLINWSTVTIPTSDEQLNSRPMRLEAGTQYKISFLSKVGKNGASMPLAVNLYKVDGETRTLAGSIWSGTVTWANYEEMILKADVTETGIYEVEFSVVNSEPVDFKIYLGKFRFTKTYDYDLSLEEIVMPTANISCYNNFPLGAIVRNEGKKAITAFSLKANSPSIGEVKRDYSGISLQPNDTYLIYFDRDLTFNGSDSETLTVEVVTEGDGDNTNNLKTMNLNYVEPETVPYSPNPFVALDTWAVINRNKDVCRFVPVKNATVGFQYVGSKDIEANDLVATPCISFEKATTYSLDFRFGVIEGDTAAVEVYAYDATADKKVDLVRLESIVKGAQYLGYFTVPEDGNYNICFAPLGKTASLSVSASFAVRKVTEKPEVQLLEVTAPKGDAVYSAKEKLTVTFQNKGKLPLASIPFICKVGDKEYRSFYSQYISANNNDSYTMEFPEIDLYAPGEYTIQVSADVAEELTPDDNVVTYKIKSLPVPDVAVVSLDAPQTGLLGNEEVVTITLKNEGKGVLTDIPVQCVVTTEGGYTKTLTGTVAGPLADGKTIQYAFDEAVDLYDEDTYHFVITTALPDDVNEGNNRLETSIASSHKNFDAGVTEVLSPVDAILTEAEIVKVAVHNYSEVDLFDVRVMAEVTYLGTDGPDAQVVTGVVPSIKPGESVEYAFADAVMMKKAGEYRIKSYTTVPNDVNPDNDACTVTVKCLTQDVGVITILSPETGEDLGIQDVTIEVKNFGEAAVSRIPVCYTIGTMPQLGTIDETIQPGETIVYTFPTQYEFVAYKKYTVVAVTLLEDDANAENDACTKEVENKQLSGIHSVTATLLSVYPNPTAGEITITTGDAAMLSVSIYNLQGQLLQRHDDINAPEYRMNPGLANGTYIVRVMTSVGTVNCKLIVRN